MKILNYVKAKATRDALKSPPMDVVEYCRKCQSGCVCLFCGGDDVEEDLGSDAFGGPSSSNTCADCKTKWIDVYELQFYVGYIDQSGSDKKAGEGEAIVAVIQLPSGATQEIDVTWRALHLPIETLQEMEDDSEDAKSLVSHLHKHNEPFGLKIKQSIMDFFGVDDLQDLTEEMVDGRKPLVIKVPMTVSEFVASGGDICPYCGSYEIEDWNTEFVGKMASVSIACQNCEEQWINSFCVVECVKV